MTSSSIRALARLGRRDIASHRVRSLLVTLLVLLPVAAMVAGIALYRTVTPTQEDWDVAQMGQADLLAVDATRPQLHAILPSGSVLEPLASGDDRIVLPGARPSVSLRGMRIDGLARGMVRLTAGVAPKGTHEVAISASAAKLAGTTLGQTLELEGLGSVTAVGLVENPMYLGDRTVVVDPDAAPVGDDQSATWLVRLPEGTDAESVAQANIDPPTGAQLIQIQWRASLGVGGAREDSVSPTILILGSLALVEAALIASAAFAVSIRRRQRELGLLAAAGATPRQLAGTVVAEAAMLGVAASAAGVIIGLIAALALTPWLDDLTQRRNPPLVIDLGGLIEPAVIGFLAAMLAAILPSRTVSRIPILMALSGRRPPQTPARRTLVIGLVAVLLAAGMTVVGATMIGAGREAVSIFLLIGGAVLSTLGFGACAPWLLEKLEPIAARLPLAARIAFRDTARGRSRSSPIVTAILASLAAVVAIGAWQTSRDAENLRGWAPTLYGDELSINGPGATSAAEALRNEPGVLRAVAIPSLVFDDPNVMARYQLPDAHDASGKLINLLDGCENCNPGVVQPYEGSAAAAATPDLLALAHVEDAEEDLRHGRAVVLSNRATTASTLEILVFRDPNSGQASERLTLPIRLIHVPIVGSIPDVFLPEPTIKQLGLVEAADVAHQEQPLLIQYDHPVTNADVAHAQAVAARYPDTFAYVDTPPGGEARAFRLLITGLVLLFAVSVTGIAIALGEAESRPEQRSLLAIGADPRLRRRMAASRAAVLALLAGMLAVPAGLLPVWGIFASRGSPLAVPTIEIAGAVLVLPVLAIASSWVLSRPIPDWSAFRDVGSG